VEPAQRLEVGRQSGRSVIDVVRAGGEDRAGLVQVAAEDVFAGDPPRAFGGVRGVGQVGQPYGRQFLAVVAVLVENSATGCDLGLCAGWSGRSSSTVGLG
jgi:hypothetical protein